LHVSIHMLNAVLYYDWADDSHQGTNSEQDRFWGYNKLAQDWH